MARRAANLYIYRNLTPGKPRYSIRYKGRVVARTDTLFVTRPTFSVSEAGQSRVRREGKKYVHAFVIVPNNGDASWPMPSLDLGSRETWMYSVNWRPVTYNPYVDDQFVLSGTNEPVKSATAAVLNKHGVFVLFPEE